MSSKTRVFGTNGTYRRKQSKAAKGKAAVKAAKRARRYVNGRRLIVMVAR